MKAVPLSQVCKIVNGGTPKSGVSEYWEGDVAWLTPAEMGKLKSPFIGMTARTITQAGLKNSSARQVPVGAVIMSTRAPIGHLAIPEIPMAFNQGCRGLVPNDSLDTKFLYYFLWFSREALNELGTGATFKELASSALGNFEIPLPSLEEQRRIVAVLDEAFAVIATATANAQKNLANARELLLDATDRELAAGGTGWDETTLEEICSRFEYGTSAKSKPYGQVPVLRMGNVQNGEIDWSDLVFTDDPKDIRQLSLRPMDVLFNRTNSLEHVGKTAIVRDDKPAIFAGYLIRLHYRPEVIDPEFLNLHLNSRSVRTHGRALAGKSVNQANISAGKLKTFPIQLPPLVQQQSIVSRISELQDCLEQLQAVQRTKLDALAALKQSLLHRAFTGELTATPDLVPA